MKKKPRSISTRAWSMRRQYQPSARGSAEQADDRVRHPARRRRVLAGDEPQADLDVRGPRRRLGVARAARDQRVLEEERHHAIELDEPLLGVRERGDRLAGDQRAAVDL